MRVHVQQDHQGWWRYTRLSDDNQTAGPAETSEQFARRDEAEAAAKSKFPDDVLTVDGVTEGATYVQPPQLAPITGAMTPEEPAAV